MRLALYYRTSTDRQDLDSQRHEVEGWLARMTPEQKPSSIVEFQDVGHSGKTTERPAFHQMLSAAYEKSIDAIAVYRLDRFSRDASSAIRLILQLEELGVAFISVTQPILNLGHENPFRRTILTAFAEIAEIERDTLIARVNAGIQAAKQRGVVFGPPRKLTPEKIEIAEKLRSKGLSMRAIAKEVELSLGTVARIFTPPRLPGVL